MQTEKTTELTTTIVTLEQRPEREMVDYSIKSTFNLKLKGDIKVKGFSKPGPLTPEIDPYYVFPVEETVMFLMALNDADNIYLKGHSGTGKTQFVRQVAARLNYNVVQVNFDGHLLRSDLVGEVRISGGNTEFRYGLIPMAFREPGTILLLDEVDAVAPETAFVLQRAVSEDRTFLLNETNEVIKLHSQNRICATANTNGLGDDTSLYQAGTNVQNFSFLNRWSTTIEIDYVSDDIERQILKGNFPDLDDNTINGVVSVMKHARSAFKANNVTIPLTIRDSIAWCRKLTQSTKPMRTAKYAFLNRMPRPDAMTIAQQIQRSFRLDADDDKTFLGK